MAVPDDLVDKAVKSTSSFRDDGGNFNPQILILFGERGWNHAEFAAVTRRNILTYQFQRAIVAGGQRPQPE
jgi:hypothetical protein